MTPASIDLTARGIPHREFTHAGPIHSLEQAAAERRQQPGQVVRSILFRVSENEYVLAVVAGPSQIAWAKLRKHLGQSRVSMANPEEVQNVTGFIIGAVSPFGLRRQLRTLLDRSVLAQEEVSVGSGIRGTTIFMRVADLRRALAGAETVDLL